MIGDITPVKGGSWTPPMAADLDISTSWPVLQYILTSSGGHLSAPRGHIVVIGVQVRHRNYHGDEESLREVRRGLPIWGMASSWAHMCMCNFNIMYAHTFTFCLTL